ncbi:MAG TPA: double-strand break repair protein AddB [Sphingomonadaceae bacterium]|nr:double-strand break repair protein AddB [Sphingomonadaceae bacterium]
MRWDDARGESRYVPAVPATPSVFTIPPHRSFSDALVAGIMAAHGGEPLALARGTILLPNNRAARAVSDAFVRRTGTGLLLPRLVPIGDPELDERIGGAFDPAGGEPVPPAVDPLVRQMRLARLVQDGGDGTLGAAEAMRLAAELARTLDALTIEGVPPSELANAAADAPDLSAHWQVSLERLQVIMMAWPRALAELGRIDMADRRNRLLNALARRWRSAPPPGFVVAAGITTTAVALARLLGVVARLERGEVVLPALDLGMSAAEWDALGPHEPDPETGIRRRSIETHPQFALKLLLDRMAVGRGEVQRWRHGGGRDAPAVRTRAIGNAMAPARFTGKWQDLPPAQRRMSGVRVVEAADPAQEAQGIALALRGAMETPGRTAALVTPDRMLARRVSAHLKRWGIQADDSAGRPLSETPAGTLLLAIAAAGAERFAPVALLTLLKHPLVAAGDGRLAWLDGVRLLDLALRGPRPPAGLEGLARFFAQEDHGRVRVRAGEWFADVRPMLEPLEAVFAGDSAPGLTEILAVVRETASALAGDAAWSGVAGREAAKLIADAEDAAPHGPAAVASDAVVPLLGGLLEAQAVRPPFGGHPRIFIWGLLEARLQHADLMVLGGLNEGTWPALPTPDAWLAPKIRANLGLPGLDRRIGLAAHDFASALGGREVIVTRARRDARAPAIASRFWLRLEAMTGGMTRAPDLPCWARRLGAPGTPVSPAARPAPSPPAALRPRRLAVTDLDRLKADPYAFYAKSILGLRALDGVDADPSAAWRGTAVHDVLERWFADDVCDPAKLVPRAEAMLNDGGVHPLLRALWQPRLMEAIAWISARMAEDRGEGRLPRLAEVKGVATHAGVELHGKADRIDVLADGSLAIVDYKTGKPPSGAAVKEGFAMQLGLLGLIAERGGFGIQGKPSAFEYWSLAKSASGSIGYAASPVGGRSGIEPDRFTALAAHHLEQAAARWLTGVEPFIAKLQPEYAPYGDYDQLMRLDEWYGRDGG